MGGNEFDREGNVVVSRLDSNAEKGEARKAAARLATDLVPESDQAAAIMKLLDATLVAHGVCQRPQLSLLPSADVYPLADRAVREWTAANGGRVTEWGHDGLSSSWIEGIRAVVAGDDICTLHTPQECMSRQPVDAAPALIRERDEA